MTHIAVMEKSAAQIDAVENDLARLGERYMCKHGAGYAFILRIKICTPEFRSIKKFTTFPIGYSMKFCMPKVCRLSEGCITEYCVLHEGRRVKEIGRASCRERG